MTTFHELVQSFGLEGRPGLAADAVMNDLRLTDHQRSVLSGIIYEACALIDRHRVRRMEIENRPGRIADVNGDRARLMLETFALGDGRRVAWGEATVADHKARIELLAKLRDGIAASIQRHQEAIDELLAAGVSCLNDLQVVAA